MKRSGAASSQWTYWKDFVKTFTKDRPMSMENVFELVDPESSLIIASESSKDVVKEDKVENLKKVKIDTLLNLNKLISKELSDNNKNINMEVKINSIEISLKEYQKETSEKLQKIFELLKKDD